MQPEFALPENIFLSDPISLVGLEDFLQDTSPENIPPVSINSNVNIIDSPNPASKEALDTLEIRVIALEKLVQVLTTTMSVQSERLAALPYYQRKIVQLEKALLCRSGIHRIMTDNMLVKTVKRLFGY